MNPRHAVFLLLLTAGLLGAAQAQPPVRDASVEELVDQLAPARALTRGLRNLVPEKRQIDLVINFDFDSARLQAASKPLLEKLAEALGSDRLQALRFKVEGHTDAQGSAAYNEALSARRAQSVLAFLQTSGVAAGRLQAEGRGATELLDPAHPQAPENRRVRISTVD